MNNLLKILALFALVVMLSCSSARHESTFLYLNEEAIITKYNAQKTKLPLLIVVPDVDATLFHEDVLKKLSRNYRVTSISFLSERNKIRQKQIDNILTRTNFYSDQLRILTSVEKDSIVLLTEGLNANILCGMVHSFPIKQTYLTNPYYPTLKEALTTTCYAQQRTACDSLISHLAFGYRYAIDSVFVEISNPKRDNQYGRHTTSFWKEALDVPAVPASNLYKGSLYYVFTDNSGLTPTKPPQNTSTCKKSKLNDSLAYIIRN